MIERYTYGCLCSCHQETRNKVSSKMSVKDEADHTDLTAKYEDQETTSLLQDISLGHLEPSSTIEKTIHIEALYPGTKLIDLSLQASLDENMESGRVEEINHTVELAIEDPFKISSSVMYRQSSRAAEGDGVEGWASVMSLLSVSGRGMEVVSIDIEPKVCSRAG